MPVYFWKTSQINVVCFRRSERYKKGGTHATKVHVISSKRNAMSYQNNNLDEITVEDDKRDGIVMEEGLTQSKSWEQVKAEAERDEEWQHSLSLFQSLKINRAVSTLSPQCTPHTHGVLTRPGGPLVDSRLGMYHHGVLRYSSAGVPVWSTCFQGALR